MASQMLQEQDARVCPVFNVSLTNFEKSELQETRYGLLCVFCVAFAVHLVFTALLKGFGQLRSRRKKVQTKIEQPVVTATEEPNPSPSLPIRPVLISRTRKSKSMPCKYFTTKIKDKHPQEESRPLETGSQENPAEYRMGGYMPVYIGEKLGNYTVVRKLGFGHFSTVWLCTDNQDINRRVAVKVVKSTFVCENMACEEIKLLTKLRTINPEHPGKRFIINLLDYFNVTSVNGRHTCIAFELMGPSLLHLITQSEYRGIFEPAVKSIIRQVLQGLVYLHESQVIHTDLKPENILIKVNNEYIQNMIDKVSQYRQLGLPMPKSYVTSHVNRQLCNPRFSHSSQDDCSFSRSSSFPLLTDLTSEVESVNRRINSKKELYVSPRIEIKIADMGNACFQDEKIKGTIQTKQYRALEVLLGADYDTPVDIWSVGCIAFELATGEFLFNPRSTTHFSSSEDHILLIYELLEGIPPYIASRGKRSRCYFEADGSLIRPATEDLHLWKTEDVLVEKYEWKRVDAIPFASMINAMIEPDPELRITARNALLHQWLNDNWP